MMIFTFACANSAFASLLFHDMDALQDASSMTVPTEPEEEVPPVEPAVEQGDFASSNSDISIVGAAGIASGIIEEAFVQDSNEGCRKLHLTKSDGHPRIIPFCLLRPPQDSLSF